MYSSSPASPTSPRVGLVAIPPEANGLMPFAMYPPSAFVTAGRPGKKFIIADLKYILAICFAIPANDSPNDLVPEINPSIALVKPLAIVSLICCHLTPTSSVALPNPFIPFNNSGILESFKGGTIVGGCS